MDSGLTGDKSECRRCRWRYMTACALALHCGNVLRQTLSVISSEAAEGSWGDVRGDLTAVPSETNWSSAHWAIVRGTFTVHPACCPLPYLTCFGHVYRSSLLPTHTPVVA